MSILVTGATGFVGSYLCKRLVSEGQQVIGLIHNRTNPVTNTLLKSPNFRVCNVDIRNKDVITKIVQGNKIETIFHTAAVMPYNSEKDYWGVNTKGTNNLLDTIRYSNVEEFIYTSSMSVYSEPPSYLPVDELHPTKPSSMYGITKLIAEISCIAYNDSARIIILRYGGTYGIGMDNSRAIAKFVRCALNNQPVTVFGKGEQSNDFVYINDVVQGTYLAWRNKKSGIYNIGSGQEASISNLARKIIELTDFKSHIVYSNDKADRPFRFVLDITKARNNLGYSPNSLDDGLKLYIEEVKHARGETP